MGRVASCLQRNDGRGQPLGRRTMQVVERDEGDMEEVGAASGIVARQRGNRRLHLGRRLGHDVEGVSGAHGWECSMVWGRVGLASAPCSVGFGDLVNCHLNHRNLCDPS